MGGLSSAEQLLVLQLAALYGVPVVVTICAVLYKAWAARTPALQHALATDLVGQVVDAVEQIHAGGGATADVKRTMAEQLAVDVLKTYHISVDPAVLNVLIESAVAGLNAVKALPTPVSTPVSAPSA